MVEFYKGDEQEQKFYDAARPILSVLSNNKTNLYNFCDFAFPLGDLIHDSDKSPLAKNIRKSLFREIYQSLFSSFVFAGSAESYISVFKAIFGDDSNILFDVPGPGKLNITIEASGLELSDFTVRTLVGETYVFDQIIDREGDQIQFRSIRGIDNDYELNQMLFEMVPAGIYTTFTLTVG